MNKRPRLRDLGITIGYQPTGPLNAITDVPGIRVGHTTVIHDEDEHSGGAGPARTGVTAIHPHEGFAFTSLVPAAIDVLNGCGEVTGRSKVDEYGLLESPILITNTLSVGEVHRASVEWLSKHESMHGDLRSVIPVVAETNDSYLNDITGQHVTREHVFAALDNAASGPVREGNVGGGTGMRLFGFKGGIGTASRMVTIEERDYTVGVLVQANFGAREDLLVDGVPVGREMPDNPSPNVDKDGSVIVVIATDAPLTDRQLRRLCQRSSLGLGRAGGVARHTSGDFLIGFSNARENRVERHAPSALQTTTMLNDTWINPFFVATIEATEESVLNGLVAAETMVGRDGHTVEGIPHERLLEVMKRFGRVR